LAVTIDIQLGVRAVVGIVVLGVEHDARRDRRLAAGCGMKPGRGADGI
jgi:hypothetical protein